MYCVLNINKTTSNTAENQAETNDRINNLTM
jgi:hypothetical protein